MIFFKKIVVFVFLGLTIACSKNDNENLEIEQSTNPLSNLIIFDHNGEISILEAYENESFKNWYVLQTKGDFEPKKIVVEGEVHFHKNFLKIINGKENYLFYLEDEDLNNHGGDSKASYQGFGLARHVSKFKYLLDKSNKQKNSSARDLIVNLLIDKNSSISELAISQRSGCTSGGEGSSGCSIQEDVVIASPGCSVDCQPGYYACCQSSNVTCTCVEEDPETEL